MSTPDATFAVALPTTKGVIDAPGFIRRLLSRRIALACIAYLAILVVISIVAPIVLPAVSLEHAGDLFAVRKGPSWHHLLGTDTLGRDVLDRLLVGTRVTMIGVAQALIVVLVLGVPLGLVAGYFGKWIDRVVTWLGDLTFSMPAIVIILVVLSVFPGSLTAAMVTMGILAAPGLMRVVRAATLPVREELYIAAARVSGLSHFAIIRRHVLPRVAGPVIVQASLLSAVALLVQTGLAFLGVVVQAPAPSWGGMVGDGISVIILQPWLLWPPGMVITITVLALGLLGDAVRDATAEAWSASPIVTRARPLANLSGMSATERVAEPQDAHSVLVVEHLGVVFPSPTGESLRVIEDVTFNVGHGEAVGIVGETGCGKTVTAMAIIGLLPGGGQIDSGRIAFGGQNLATLSEHELRRIRGKEVALISQEPMISLNPTFKIGWQLSELVGRHHGVSRRAAQERSLDLLRSVHLPDAELVANRYPYELSGGMAQRVAIARALAGEPELLIADEPTTALDVTVQAEILDLLRELQQGRNMAILLVTHDWGVVADICDRVVVMYAGQVVEQAKVNAVFREPLHPYTQALLSSNPHNLVDQRTLPTIPGGVPKPGAWPTGCRFHPRCQYATEECGAPIALEQPAAGRETRCIHYSRLKR